MYPTCVGLTGDYVDRPIVQYSHHIEREQTKSPGAVTLYSSFRQWRIVQKHTNPFLKKGVIYSNLITKEHYYKNVKIMQTFLILLVNLKFLSMLLSHVYCSMNNNNVFWTA
jgi:hypothetical protein